MNRTKIQWTETTWNPVTGCTKISDGCKHCYAERMARRLKAMGNERYKDGFKVTVQEDLIDQPLHIRKPKMIFVNSMSDLFHDDVPEEIIIRIFKTMNQAYWHTFQVLTKRPERMLELDKRGMLNWTDNIWMGVTIESNKYYGRITALKKSHAKTKFVSCEPLIGKVTFRSLKGIDWVIVGGESGPGSRPMEKEWVSGIKEKCEAENVPFFFKQWGGFNKKKAGRELNGRTYDEYPEREQDGMKEKPNTSKYSELYQQKFLDAFPPEPMSELSDEQLLRLKELAEIVRIICLEEWSKEPTGFQVVNEKFRNENPDKRLYDIEPERLQTKDVLYLIVYPFWKRMGGSFEERFALRGDLGKYLRILKEREISG